MLHFVGKFLQGQENYKKVDWDLKRNSDLLKNSVDFFGCWGTGSYQ